MRGKPLILGFLAFVALFAAALWWFQIYAFYERTAGVDAITVAGAPVPVAGYEGIDAATSPLKLRGCFRADPAAFAAAPLAPEPTPLVAPFWFRCFDARAIAEDLAARRAVAYALESDRPPGFDLVAALYPDGRGFIWRQLNDRFR